MMPVAIISVNKMFLHSCMFSLSESHSRDAGYGRKVSE